MKLEIKGSLAEDVKQKTNVPANDLYAYKMNARLIVFAYWEPHRRQLCGYVYNDVRFTNGMFIVLQDDKKCIDKDGNIVAWCIKTSRSTFNVKEMSPLWKQVGAGKPLNRLKYKLWPALVFIMLLSHSRRKLYAPGGIAYNESKARFENMAKSV